MKKQIVLLLILSPIIIFCKKTPTVTSHGTLIIAMKCSDGIIIASDSREGLLIRGELLAYRDCVQKIYLAHTIPFATSWNGGGIGYRNLSEVINEYNLSYASHEDSKSEGFRMFKWFKEKYPAFQHAFFIFAHYDEGVQKIGVLNFDEGSLDYFVSYHSNEIGIAKYIKDRNFTCSEFINFITPVIKQYAIDSKQQNSIGGPVTILKINPDNSTQFVQNDFTKRQYKNYMGYIDDVLNEKVKLHYLYKDARSKIIAEFSDMKNYLQSHPDQYNSEN